MNRQHEDRDARSVRQTVSKAYAQAIGGRGGSSCCCDSCQTSEGPGALDAKHIGYTNAELDGLPPGTQETSFGCGNPLAFSEVREGETVLDLGSGAGLDLLIAARRVGPSGSVIGVDMTDAMIAKARENATAAGFENVGVRKGIIENLPVDSASVDWVISNCVINLSPEKGKVFAEIARVLKPGGRMLVSDIVAEDLPDWVRENKALYSQCIAGAISEPEYVAGLREAGLGDVDVVERHVYTASEIEAFIRSEKELLPYPAADAGEITDREQAVARIVGALGGKVWSAKFAARKSS